jgi:crotonobetainyl-CoA:carnitine CoA-transferase CaiB-like acyl-CoA transferase
MNVYPAADDTWFVLLVMLDKLAASWPFSRDLCQHAMPHWHEVFNGVHVAFGAVRGPQKVINDPQLQLNDIIVPLAGAGGTVTSTISSPIQVRGVTEVPARRAPKIGEHHEQILKQLGFSAADALRASGAVPAAKERVA